MASSTIPLEPTTTAPRGARGVLRFVPEIPRVLLGAQFLFAGLVGLFMHPEAPPGLPAAAIAFNDALTKTGYMLPLVCVVQALSGVLLLANRFVPLALTLLAPIVVNIFAFHFFLEPSGRPVAVVIAALELFVAWQHRAAFRGMLAARVQRTSTHESTAVVAPRA